MNKTVHQMLAKRLGRNIRHCRRDKDLTQEQLAEHLDVDTLTVSRYETGHTLPPLTTVYVIARFLNVRLADLVGKDVPFKPVSHAQRFELWVDGLSPADCDWIEGIVKLLAARCKQGALSVQSALESHPPPTSS